MRATLLGAPPPPLRVLARSRARGSEGEGAGPPLRGSHSDWSAPGMTSQTPVPRRRSPGRRVPHRAKAKSLPAMSPSQSAAPWLGEPGERWRPDGGQAPSPRGPQRAVPTSRSDGALPGWRARDRPAAALHWRRGRGAGGAARERGRAGPSRLGRRSREPETRKTDAILEAAACSGAESRAPAPQCPRDAV